MKLHFYISIILITIFVIACNNKKDDLEDKNLTDQQLFLDAMKFYDAAEYSTAKKYFIKITTDYPYSTYASKAQYYEGCAEYKSHEYSSAIIALDEYISLYPGGEQVQDAMYLKALCYYDQIVEINLDQDVAVKAEQGFKELLARFPNSEYSQDVHLKLDLIADQLAGKELSIARYYLLRGNAEAAINRLQNVVKNYQTTNFIEEALYRLVEAENLIGLDSEAKKYAAILGKNYPKSTWYFKAYNLLNAKK